MKILSLGAGVQSSTLAFMAEHGEIDVDCAIFADTGAEPIAVYNWLNHLRQALSFPVYIVSHGNLEEDAPVIRKSKKTGNLYMKGLIPAFILKEDGKKGLLGRKCTADYKILPIQQKVRELLGIKRIKKDTPAVDMLIGISTDEAHRMKPSRLSIINNVYPLIDKDMTRGDCFKWMKEHGYPEPPRSSCVFCPFHGDDEWRKLIGTPDFDRAVNFEKKLQESARKQNALKGMPYLHNSCKPLETINFKDDKAYKQLDWFGNECEGLCGV